MLHINFNDGFRGGARVLSNIVFGSCRESGDHGPLNSWDRDPYFFDDPVTGLPGSTTKAHDEIAHNYIFANGNTLGPVDNDDGSSYYNTHHNFFVWGAGGMKTDFEGTDSIWDSNVVALSYNPAIHNGYVSRKAARSITNPNSTRQRPHTIPRTGRHHRHARQCPLLQGRPRAQVYAQPGLFLR